MTTLTERNTLNDALYADRDISDGIERSKPASPIVGDEYDVVNGFFVKVMKDPSAAENFTQALYRVAKITQTDVLKLLDTLKGKDEIEVNAIMAYYLNSLRSPSTLIGVQNPTRPNYYAGRNVLS
jgi:hypothetical protein